MNGFFIVIELSGLQQFLIVDAPASNEMIKNCERSINSTVRANLQIQGSFLIFPIQAELENAAAVIEAAENLLEIINGYTEEIHEFSMMLLYRKGFEASAIDAELKQNYYLTAVDRALLIEKKIVNAAGMAVSKNEEVQGYHLIKTEDGFSDSVQRENLIQLINDDDVNHLVKMMVPDISNPIDCRNFELFGESELILKLNLNEALKLASGKNRNSAAVYIDFLDSETDVVMPFFRSVDRQLIPIVEEHLDGVELKTWTAGRSKLDYVNSDYPEEYFFSIYCLYLKGIIKFFRQALQPPVIVISGVSSESEAFIRYTERIMDYLDAACSPIVFFINPHAQDDPFNYELSSYFKDTEKIECGERITAPDGAARLSYLNSRLLYVINLTEGLFVRKVLDEFLIRLGFSQSEISLGIKLLENEGCIINNRFIKIIETPGFDKIAARISEKEEISKSLAGYLTENIYSDICNDYGRAANKLGEFAADPVVGEAVYRCLTIMLDLGRSSFVIKYLSENSVLDNEIADALALRCFLIENDKASCINLLKDIPEKPESPYSINNALLLLEASRYYHAMNDYQRALDYIKKVLIFLQEGNHPRLEGIAFVELGFLMLCKGKLLESSEYMNLAVEKLTGSGDSFSLMKALLFTAVGQYLWGSLDSAMDFTERSLEKARSMGFEEWQFYIEFFKCRLLFELGRYYDAEKMLSECLLRTEIYRDVNRKKIFSAWTARACIYQGKIYRGINMLLSLNEDPEVQFFLSEAYYFNGNMERAIESIERAAVEDSYFDLGFLPLEHVSWKNGFSSIEGRVLRSEKGTGVLLHNIRALQAFLLGMTGNREYGMEILFSLTRDEKISENDPYNRLYFYFYCQLLENRQNTEMIDKLTLISKALKYLQQTSSRINDPKVRQQFMIKNYWNSRLVAEAQKEKLI